MKDDPIWARDEIESPCIKICTIHPETRLCVGCARSASEIAVWSMMSPEERRAVMAELPSRDAEPRGRRGGRAARIRQRSRPERT